MSDYIVLHGTLSSREYELYFVHQQTCIEYAQTDRMYPQDLNLVNPILDP
jgi:hypothetical protein